MKIRVSDIGPDGLKIQDTISSESLNKRMSEGRSNDIIFLKDPLVDVVVHKTASGASTKGRITTRYKQPCSLCADEIDRELEIEGNFLFQRRSIDENARREDKDDAFFDDIGVNYFTGDHIDLEDIIQESLILSLTPYLRPPLLADGSCAFCYKKPTLSQTSEDSPKPSFGQLLKNAGVR